MAVSHNPGTLVIPPNSLQKRLPLGGNQPQKGTLGSLGFDPQPNGSSTCKVFCLFSNLHIDGLVSVQKSHTAWVVCLKDGPSHKQNKPFFPRLGWKLFGQGRSATRRYPYCRNQRRKLQKPPRNIRGSGV